MTPMMIRFKEVAKGGMLSLFFLFGGLVSASMQDGTFFVPSGNKEVIEEVIEEVIAFVIEEDGSEVIDGQELYESGVGALHKIIRSRDLLRSRLKRLYKAKEKFEIDQQELQLLASHLNILFPGCSCDLKNKMQGLIGKLRDEEQEKLVRDGYYWYGWYGGTKSLLMGGALGILTCISVGVFMRNRLLERKNKKLNKDYSLLWDGMKKAVKLTDPLA